MTKLTPTEEQSAILSAGTASRTSLMIQAYAGAAKTSTLVMLSEVLPKTPALALAFNLKIKKTLERKLPPHFEVKTLNGLGHVAWGRAIGKRLVLEENKLSRLTTTAMKELSIPRGETAWADLKKLVTVAQHAGIVPEGFAARGLVPDTDEVWEELAFDGFLEFNEELLAGARWVLRKSIEEGHSGIISFDDQIYLSVLFGGQFPRFPLVFADEAQDFSLLNIKMLRACSTDRLIIVGDPLQSVYAWRGAHGDAMEQIKKLRNEWIELPLTVTFRCPEEIVARQRRHAPGFRAAPGNPQGSILTWLGGPGRPGPSWNIAKIRAASGPGPIAFLCRNNAPLIKTAFRLIADGVGCTMLGRDIGKNLEALSKKILPLDDIKAEACAKLINDWASKQISLATANGQEGKVSGFQDRRDCLLAVLESTVGGPCETSGELRKRLRRIFLEGDDKVVLATGHRAKGMEWPIVVHLDPWRIPSKQAKRAYANGNPVPYRQELNLRYVIETRAMSTLILAETEVYEGEKEPTVNPTLEPHPNPPPEGLDKSILIP